MYSVPEVAHNYEIGDSMDDVSNDEVIIAAIEEKPRYGHRRMYFSDAAVIIKESELGGDMFMMPTSFALAKDGELPLGEFRRVFV